MTWRDRSAPGTPELLLGQVAYRGTAHRFGLLAEDRLRHIYVLGATGVGKSTLLEQIAVQDILAGRGLAVIDPHGSLVDALIGHLPRWRLRSTLLIDPSDALRPIAFNVFRRGVDVAAPPSLLASQIISIFKARWADSFGPRMEHVLRMALLATAAHPEATLLLLYQVLTAEDVRTRVLRHVTDPLVTAFWRREFPGYAKAFRAEMVSPVLNKLGALLSSDAVRPLVTGVRSRVDWASLMEERAVVLADLSVGRIGEDASHLIASLLLSSLHMAAFARVTRTPFTAVVDEFQNAVTATVPTVLAEARKYRLGLVLAHQYLAQVPSAIRDAVIGNVGTMVLLRLGGADADVLAPEVAPQFSGNHLQHLPRFHAIVRMTARGGLLDPFLATTLPPPKSIGAVTREEIARASFARFGADPRTLSEGARRAFSS